MSVKEILVQVESLSTTEQNEVAALLTHLRHKKDPLFFKQMAERASRKDSTSWKSLEEFENEGRQAANLR